MLSWFLLLFLCLHFHCTCGLDDQKYKRVITINVNGSSNIDCCKYHLNCDCSSLESALNYVRDDTLINIISSIVPLLSLIKISGHTTIGISGNNGTVISCNNTGGVSFVNCKNIDISGITWDQCGGTWFTGAVSMEHSSNISIHNCTFQQSYTYCVTIFNASAMVIITYTKFLHNTAGLYLQQTQSPSTDYNLHVLIANSIFEHNGEGYCYACGGLKIWTNDSSAIMFVTIRDSNFLNNSALQGGGIYLDAVIKTIEIQFTNVTVANNSAGIYCYTKGTNAVFNVNNSIIMNSLYLQFSSLNVSLSIFQSSVGVTKGSIGSLHVETFSKYLLVDYCTVNFTRTKVVHSVRNHPNYCVLKFNELISDNTSLQVDGKESFGFQCYITNCIFSNNSNENPVVDIFNVNLQYDHPNIHATIQIMNTTFSGNSNGKSVVHLVYDGQNYNPLGEVLLSSTYFNRNFDNQNTLYLYYSKLKVTGKLSFNNNAADKGAGIFLTNYSYVSLHDGSQMEFTNNVAALGGGAIYADCPSPEPSPPWLLFSTSGTVNVTFHNNQAHAAGNSIFFNIPVDVSSDIIRDPSNERSIMYIPKRFNYSGNKYQDEIATSPYAVTLGQPAVCSGDSCDDGGTYSLSDIMLGENLSVPANMIDFFGHTAEPCLFQIDCYKNCDNHSLSGFTEFKYALIHNDTLQSIAILGNKVVNRNTTVGLRLSPVFGTVTKEVRSATVELEIFMCPCRTGYKYDRKTKSCVCNNIPDLVRCEQNSVNIKKGYWYGNIGKDVGVGVCPNNYCTYPSCAITDKFCKLSQTLDDQCYKHRRGTACGECDPNHTLAFDSSDCIPTSECQVKWTVLVVIIVVLYWIVALFTIISVMYFVKAPTITGYVYGIIYFYSILDLFIGENLVVSDSVVQFVTIISGITNLTPRFLNRLCFVKGLSGIDQQFIHYIHPLAISFMLFLISRAARRSPKVTAVLSKAGIVRSTCLLILLFYTSLSSTSLHLLRPLQFNGVDGFFTYSSPDIKYFNGRHIIYGIVALVCLFVVVLGLPIFLFLQPFLRRCKRLNFIRIMPILDQFQQCYKLKYHSAAAFYLICRLVLFSILGLDIVSYSNRFFVLQVVCFLIAMAHAWLQPYKDDKLNSLDQMILLVALMIVSLNIGIPFTSLDANKRANDFVIIILALLPLVLFVGHLLSSVLARKLPCGKTDREATESLLRLDNYVVICMCLLPSTSVV